MFMCIRAIIVISISMIFLLDFETVLTVWYFFHFPSGFSIIIIFNKYCVKCVNWLIITFIDLWAFIVEVSFIGGGNNIYLPPVATKGYQITLYRVHLTTAWNRTHKVYGDDQWLYIGICKSEYLS